RNPWKIRGKNRGWKSAFVPGQNRVRIRGIPAQFTAGIKTGPQYRSTMKSAAPSKARLYLVGAGISVDEPAGVASVPALLELLYSWIANGNSRLKRRFWAATATSSRHNPFGALRFETVVQTILEVEPALRDVLPSMAKHGAPNSTHQFLANEIANG